nr:hypothetical protein [Tanacetum cinerariifolium]
MFGVNNIDDDELIVESVDVAEPAKEVVDDITLAKALMEIKSVKHKAAKVVIQEQEQEKRRKFFVAKRVEEKRNKRPKQAQQRKIMCTYLKNIEGKKLIDLKNKSFDSIQKMFDRAFKRINTFVDFRTELVEESSKKAEAIKINDDKETAKLKQLVNIIPDKEGVLIDAIPLAVKPPSIVDWKMIKEGKKTYYKIIRVDGSSKMYLVFSHMLIGFEKEYVQTLWKLVKAKHGSTRPEDGYERVLWVI